MIDRNNERNAALSVTSFQSFWNTASWHCTVRTPSLWKKLADHGDKVRQLKGSKAVKAAMIAEVAILLYLKIELSLASQSYGRKKEK